MARSTVLQSPKHDSPRAQALYNLTLHRPSDDVAMRMDMLRQVYKGLAIDLTNTVPAGRELQQALTALEDSCMYAIAGLARAVEVAVPDSAEPATDPADEPKAT